jgi:glycosylphosphatidylinositol transamidase
MDLHVPGPDQFWLDRRAHPGKYEWAAEELMDTIQLQVAGYPVGIHSLFPRFKVDAVSFKPFRVYELSGSHGYQRIGQVMEGCLRTANNLLERLHHSYFFYLFTSPDYFISLSLYLPILSLMLGSLLLNGLHLWWTLGDEVDIDFALRPMPNVAEAKKDQIATVVTSGIPFEMAERDAMFPMLVLFVSLCAGVSVYVFATLLGPWLVSMKLIWAMPWLLGIIIAMVGYWTVAILTPFQAQRGEARVRQWMIIKCLLSLAMTPILFALSTLNFSLALLTTIVLAPVLLRIRGADIDSHPFSKWIRIAVVSFIFAKLPLWIMSAGARSAMGGPTGNGTSRIFGIMIEAWAIYGAWLLPWICIIHLPLYYSCLIISAT